MGRNRDVKCLMLYIRCTRHYSPARVFKIESCFHTYPRFSAIVFSTGASIWCGPLGTAYSCLSMPHPAFRLPLASLPCWNVHKISCLAALSFPTEKSGMNGQTDTRKTNKMCWPPWWSSNLCFSDQIPHFLFKTNITTIYQWNTHKSMLKISS